MGPTGAWHMHTSARKHDRWDWDTRCHRRQNGKAQGGTDNWKGRGRNVEGRKKDQTAGVSTPASFGMLIMLCYYLQFCSTLPPRSAGWNTWCLPSLLTSQQACKVGWSERVWLAQSCRHCTLHGLVGTSWNWVFPFPAQHYYTTLVPLMGGRENHVVRTKESLIYEWARKFPQQLSVEWLRGRSFGREGREKTFSMPHK